jgi:ubiquinone/menaquinone biosynthesis C-methylase UbiE
VSASVKFAEEGTKGRKTSATVTILRKVLPQSPRDVLVVGCGAGHEAGQLARAFGAATVGIDILEHSAFDHEGAAPARLLTMDARQMQFADATFDLVYSFHALEHIPGPERALAEMSRVLRAGGTYLIGTPNKARLVGYVGSPTSLTNKLRWNLADLGKRLSGQWRNEAGAHAGFGEEELRRLCASAFGENPRTVTDQYYLALYAHKRKAVDAVITSGWRKFVYPCVYIAGRKAEPANDHA